jgi:glutaminyl-peptide cyclotransferase
VKKDFKINGAYHPGLLISIFIVALITGSCKQAEEKRNLLPYTVVKVFPHDITAFTQGLVIEQGRLFESTGQEGSSWIAEVNITTGQQDKKVLLDKKFFGEGIAVLNNKIYQLTWKSKIGFVYDLKSFEKIGEFNYTHEGWGITHNGTHLIVSDGSNKLHFLDTATLKEIRVLEIYEGTERMDNLNELEFIEGFVFANRWQTNEVVKINLSTGQVVGRLDLTELAREANQKNPSADVLNGIAYEKKSGLLLVTGKWWPFLFALRLEEKPSQ